MKGNATKKCILMIAYGSAFNLFSAEDILTRGVFLIAAEVRCISSSVNNGLPQQARTLQTEIIVQNYKKKTSIQECHLCKTTP